MLLPFILCILCSPQLPSTPPPTPNPALMSPDFSKSVLRALLAINNESDEAITRYINDANVEAQSKAEADAIFDLQQVNRVVALNKQQVLTQIAGLRLGGLSGLEEKVQHDLKIQAWLKQNADCIQDETVIFRSRIYSPLPASCKLKDQAL